jgi:hypothetical protein
MFSKWHHDEAKRVVLSAGHKIGARGTRYSKIGSQINLKYRCGRLFGLAGEGKLKRLGFTSGGHQKSQAALEGGKERPVLMIPITTVFIIDFLCAYGAGGGGKFGQEDTGRGSRGFSEAEGQVS